MCGIFGVIPITDDARSIAQCRALVEKLLLLSESRGKDASGVAIVDSSRVTVLKQPFSASRLIRSKEFASIWDGIRNLSAVVGHARMETNGSFVCSGNNQPIVKDGCVTIHNGIIVNDRDIWSRFPDLRRENEVDTEVVNALFRKFLSEGGSLDSGILQSLDMLQGAFSIAAVFEDLDQLILATNTGSLYVLSSPDYFVFASEEYFLRKIAADFSIAADADGIRHIKARSVLFWDLNRKTLAERTFVRNGHPPIDAMRRAARSLHVIASEPHAALPTANVISADFRAELQAHFDASRRAIDALRRCSKCILPETMPFIDFDQAGVCNYCRSYRPMAHKGMEALEEVLRQYRRPNGAADCIIPFSGGRDSSYGVFLIKEKLQMTPITYTYDWGMVTDLARRNIARVCGKLGIENILISADIAVKRRNIKLNVEAWMRQPELGTIPLFMAGDKHFLYFVNQVKRATGVKLDIWLANWLEKTFFKVGFCGIAPGREERVDSISPWAKIQLLWYYGTRVLRNPAFLNRSVWDSLFAFYSYYFEPRPHYHVLYEYLPWNEREVEQTLFREFDWETAPDTSSTWRIGDGTAPFYNYIYYTIAGFSEIDTFRSNQIREGMIERSEALSLARKENEPRFEGMQWYFDAIGVNMQDCLRVVNSVRKRYEAC